MPLLFTPNAAQTAGSYINATVANLVALVQTNLSTINTTLTATKGDDGVTLLLPADIYGAANGQLDALPTFIADLQGAVALANPPVGTLVATDVASNSVVLNGEINPGGVANSYYFQWGADTNYTGGTTSIETTGAGTTTAYFSAPVTGLAVSTEYHFQIVASNGSNTFYGGDMIFTTAAAAPTVTTGDATVTGSSTAALSGTVNPNGTDASCYFQFGTTSGNYSGATSTANQDAGSGTLANTFTAAITGLAPGTTYYCRMVASVGGAFTYGGEVSFVTLASAPTATTLPASATDFSDATFNGTVNPGGAPTNYYFQYATNDDYAVNSKYNLTSGTQALPAGSTAVSVSMVGVGLSGGTTYHCRLVAINSAGTSNGADVTVTTSSNPAAVAATASASAVEAFVATLEGTVNPEGMLTSYWFEYGTDSSLAGAVATNAVVAGSGTTLTAVSMVLSGLTAGTTYYFQLMAANGANAGTPTAGGIMYFTTSAAAPTISGISVTGITGTSAAVDATINPNGSSTTYSIDYGPTSAYGFTAATLTPDSTISSLQAVVIGLSGLSGGTVYHYQISASNGIESVSGDLTFTTPGAIVTTGSATVGSTSADITGTLNPQGVASSYHFEYGTDTTYGNVTPTLTSGTGAAAVGVSKSITGLTPGRLYHYRLVASQTVGGVTSASYGNDMTLTTAQGNSPVLAFPIANIAADSLTSIRMEASINPNGSATRNCYFAWGTDPSCSNTPVLAGTPASLPAVPGWYTVKGVTNLTLSGTGSQDGKHMLYFQVVATNANGTSYSTVISFTPSMSI